MQNILIRNTPWQDYNPYHQWNAWVWLNYDKTNTWFDISVPVGVTSSIRFVPGVNYMGGVSIEEGGGIKIEGDIALPVNGEGTSFTLPQGIYIDNGENSSDYSDDELPRHFYYINTSQSPYAIYRKMDWYKGEYTDCYCYSFYSKRDWRNTIQGYTVGGDVRGSVVTYPTEDGYQDWVHSPNNDNVPGYYKYLGTQYYWGPENNYIAISGNFSDTSIFGGINYNKDLNTGNDLSIGNVSTAQISFTSGMKVDINDGYSWRWYTRNEVDEWSNNVHDGSWTIMGDFYLTEVTKIDDTHYQYTGYDALYKADESADSYLNTVSNGFDDKYHWHYYEWEIDTMHPQEITCTSDNKYYVDSGIKFFDVDDIRMQNPSYQTVPVFEHTGIEFSYSPDNGVLINSDYGIGDINILMTNGDVGNGVNLATTTPRDARYYDLNHMRNTGEYKFTAVGSMDPRYWQLRDSAETSEYKVYEISNFADLYTHKIIKFEAGFINGRLSEYNADHWLDANPIEDVHYYFYPGSAQAFLTRMKDDSPHPGLSYLTIKCTPEEPVIVKLGPSPVVVNKKDWSSTYQGGTDVDYYGVTTSEINYYRKYIWPDINDVPYLILNRKSYTSTSITFNAVKVDLHYEDDLESIDPEAYPLDGYIIEEVMGTPTKYMYYKLYASPIVETVRDLFESICNYLGIDYTVPNQHSALLNFSVENRFIQTGKTFKDLLGYVAEFLGGFIHVNRAGEASIGWYVKNPIHIDETIYSIKRLADYYAPKVDRIQIVTQNNSEYLTTGVGTNTLYIRDNPIFLVEDVSSLYEPVGELYEILNNYPTYQPGTITFLENMDIDVGDIIGNFLVFSKSLSNEGMTIGCTGNPTREAMRISSNKTQNIVGGYYSNTTEDVKEIKFEVGDNNNATVYKLYVDSTGIWAQKNNETPVPLFQ